MRYSALLDRRCPVDGFRPPRIHSGSIGGCCADVHTEQGEPFPSFLPRTWHKAATRARWWRKTTVRHSKILLVGTRGDGERFRLQWLKSASSTNTVCIGTCRTRERNLPIVMSLLLPKHLFTVCCVLGWLHYLLRGKRCYMQNNPVKASCDGRHMLKENEQ